ncbi:MAG TPA: prepilin-type N-terminal cleavage/methylation domain-containing protein, partial [Candidatus Elarobacter sp.]|nr:prepilin-type N-terminal cleavage/methylation domain-containing protein [Candidatus Elarobacter sp.]
MNPYRKTSTRPQDGFTLLELMIVCAVLAIVLGAVFEGINTVIQRSQSEQVKVDLTQAGREFVDEFERDLHEVGYPNCRIITTYSAGVGYNCPADNSNSNQLLVAQNSALAVGLVYIDNTKLIFEGDMDGNGTVDSVEYKLVDVNGTNPPASCPCTLQRNQIPKNSANPPWGQTPRNFYQELQNVVNSGQPGGTNAYGGGAPISGTTAWGASNSAYYAAISTFKDYPVFQAYDQNGNIVPLPVDLSVNGSTPTLTCSISTQ